MKRYYRDLFLIIIIIISIFFIASAFAEELQCCSQKTANAVHKDRLTDSKRAHGISQMSKARGVYGGGSIIRPKGKKNSAITISASPALLHLTTAILFHLFLY